MCIYVHECIAEQKHLGWKMCKANQKKVSHIPLDYSHEPDTFMWVAGY